MTYRILIADDEEELGMLLGEILTTFEYFESEPIVDNAESGEELLKMMAEEKYDLLITDYNMPNINGLDAIKALRGGDGQNKDTPALVLSGHVSEELNAELEAIPNVMFSEKPTPMDKMNEIVKELLKI